jgi:phosphonatase-like hydrolase
MSIKLVVFDIAGTTVKDNHEVGKAFQLALKNHDFHLDLREINPLMGYEKKLAIRRLILLNGYQEENITPELVNSIHAEFVRTMISHYQSGSEVMPLPDVEHTFAVLKDEGRQVAINTGFSRDIADSIVSRLQWKEKGLVDHVIGSDEVPLGRPYPYMIQKLMSYSGISDPLDVAKIGDTEVDIREGFNAGCRFVIGVTTGIFSRAELEPYTPTHIIDSITEVINIVKS